MRAIAPVAMIAFVVAGCSAREVAVAVPACPPSFVAYGARLQSQAAAELRDLARANRAPALRRLMTDFGNVRAELRAAGCAPRPAVDPGDRP